MQQTAATYANVVAFYGDPLPCESKGRGYMQVILAAKLGALRSVMGEDQVVRYHGPAQPAPAPAKAPRVARSKLIGAERFWSLHAAAVAACRAQYGDNWKCTAPLGDTVLVSLPAGYRSYRGPLGTKINYRRDHRMPCARFWPDGALPDGLTFSEDAPRETAARGWGDRRNGVQSATGYSEWQTRWAKSRGLIRSSGGVFLTAKEYAWGSDGVDLAEAAD